MIRLPLLLLVSLALPVLAQDPPPAPAPAAPAINYLELSLDDLTAKADGGDLEACREVARRHFAADRGVTEANEKKALFYLRQAAEGGHPEAQFEMAASAARQAGERGDRKEILHWLEKSGENYPPALRQLAGYYDRGDGVPADRVKGTELIARAAAGGDVVAVNEMGVRYQQGTGINKDPVAAVGWFSLAAQRGNTAAQINLGNCYENGIGAVVDFNRAGNHYAAAAKANHPTAQSLLGRMFEEGKGTEKNPVFAYVNYRRAGDQGIEAATKRADEIWATLGTEQKKEAEELLKPPAAPEEKK